MPKRIAQKNKRVFGLTVPESLVLLGPTGLDRTLWQWQLVAENCSLHGVHEAERKEKKGQV